ncbi:MAG: NUDIX hydrolase [Chitinophagaceae bacterium]
MKKAEKRHNILIMQNIIIHGKPVIICDQITERIQARITNEHLIQMHEPDLKNIESLLHALQDNAVYGYVWLSHQPEAVFKSLISHFEHWQAAGGLIVNYRDQVLLMFRRGKWDLPKGKMEPDETPEITARREVTEETGLHNLHIESKLSDTWHAYHQFGKDIMKQTHWFKMQFTGTELTVPQIEEDILDIQWIKPENISKYLQYSYPNLKTVFESAGYKI